MYIIFRENFLVTVETSLFRRTSSDRGRYMQIFTTVNVPFTDPTPKVGNRYG